MRIYSRFYDAMWELGELARRGETRKLVRELEKSQYFAPDQLETVRLERLRALLSHAARDVPYYAVLFRDRELDPGQLESIGELHRLPVLTKDLIRANSGSLLAASPRAGLFENATGGSTGSPLTFFQDAAYLSWWKAAVIRTRRWWGFNRGDKVAYLWGADRDLPAWNGRARAAVALKRQCWLNSFKVTPERLEAYAMHLRRWQPQYLIGYASSLEEFATFVDTNELTGIRPRAIESSAEQLWPEQRELIERVFQAPVHNVYGCREMGFVAAECESRKLHVLDDLRIVEIVDEEGNPSLPGKLGTIVVTDLTNYAMPLIRYDTGDLAEAGSGGRCACGRSFSVLERISGRSAESIRTSAGLVHSEYFAHLFYGFAGVKQFLVRQVAADEITVEIVPSEGFSADQLESIRQNIVEHTEHTLRVDFRLVDEIEPTVGGKRRIVASDSAARTGAASHSRAAS